MRRIRATVSYDGTDFQGWQVQPGFPTIQGTLEEFIGALEGAPVHVAGSGRTDAGVHALAQVVAFSIQNPIPLYNLRKALNRMLPPAIRIEQCEEIDPEFHPRFDAVKKTYEYRFWRGEVCSPHEFRYVHHHPFPLDWEAAADAAPLVEGEHDFSAFAAADVRDDLGRTKVRRIFSSRLEIAGQRCYYRVTGSGFLKHMVRKLAGTMVEVGKGNLTPEDLLRLFVSGQRRDAGPTAPAKGLFLISVEYPDQDGNFRPVDPKA